MLVPLKKRVRALLSRTRLMLKLNTDDTGRELLRSISLGLLLSMLPLDDADLAFLHLPVGHPRTLLVLLAQPTPVQGLLEVEQGYVAARMRADSSALRALLPDQSTPGLTLLCIPEAGETVGLGATAGPGAAVLAAALREPLDDLLPPMPEMHQDYFGGVVESNPSPHRLSLSAVSSGTRASSGVALSEYARPQMLAMDSTTSGLSVSTSNTTTPTLQLPLPLEGPKWTEDDLSSATAIAILEQMDKGATVEWTI